MINPLLKHFLILIKGGGDLASGVAYRLSRGGFPVVMTELSDPLFIRRTVCFGEAVYAGMTTVEGVVAHRVDAPDEARKMAHRGDIPVIVDPEARSVRLLRPVVIVDAIMAKRNTGTALEDAPLVVALGPGFTAGRDCHVVVETKRGHRLGRLIYDGPAAPDTRIPGTVGGQTGQRVLRAPADGYVEPLVAIGDLVKRAQPIVKVGDLEVRAPFDGVLRGLINPRVQVRAGLKIGDLDPRGIVDHCFTLSDKSLAVGGAVLEAILASKVVRPQSMTIE